MPTPFLQIPGQDDGDLVVVGVTARPPEEDVRSCVSFGRGLNPLVGLELSTLQPPQGEPHEEEYAFEEAPSAP